MLLKLALLPTVLGLAVRQSSSAPSATIKNGTVVGVHSNEYNQDFFLGVPFAQPPVGNLRFRQAQPINTTWSEPIQATEYYPECIGYGGDQIGYNISEDCLGLNIIRPSGYEDQKLPIALWIHGGGFVMGGASDKRYNLSFIVQNSVDIGKPIIGVSVPYRLSGWGFLDSQEIRDADATNLGIHDQRQGLAWVQENIAAFGGDPSKVTIWGESAGGISVGIHLIAYGGRDDGLFSGAISESGNSLINGGYNISVGQKQYDNITSVVGCSDSPDTLQCLREVSYEDLNKALNITGYGFQPINDGKLIQGSQVDQLNEGNFIKVPYLTGSNTDEGASFGPRGINNDTAFKAYLKNTRRNEPLDDETVEILAATYPNIPSYLEVLTDVPLNYTYNTTYGTQFRRADAFGGDFSFAAGRRLTCQSWSKQNVSSYCYRFDIRPFPVPTLLGVPHFQEVAFVFDNVMGVGYIPPISYPPFTGLGQEYKDAAKLMSKMWVSFVHDGNPNNHGLSGYPEWPEYQIESPDGVGDDYVFTVNGTSHPERDDYRAPGIAYLNSIWKTVYGR